MPPHPLLSALSARTEEDSYLVIPVGNKGLVIEKVDGPNHIKVVEEFGYEMYLHCGAIRKVLLAYQSPSFIEEYVKKIIEHDHAFPRVDAGDLRDELKGSGSPVTPSPMENTSTTPWASEPLSSTQRVNWPAPSASSPPRSA